MLAYLPLIQKILLGYMSQRSSGHSFIFNFRGLALLAFSGILGFMVLIFLLLALQTYTADLYGVPQSWALTAAATFILAFFVYLAGNFSRKKNGLVHRVKEEVEEHLTPLASIIDDLATPVKEHPVASVALAALVGLLAGDKFGDKSGD